MAKVQDVNSNKIQDRAKLIADKWASFLPFTRQEKNCRVSHKRVYTGPMAQVLILHSYIIGIL